MPGFELIGEEERSAVNAVFDKGGVLYRYGLDARRENIFRVDDFEREIARRVGSKYVYCVCNGTAALKIALIGMGVKACDEVITQSFTFIATVEAILELGAKPVITEIDDTLNMDPTDLEAKITSKTKVIIPVHMGGVPADMDRIIQVANKFNIPILEDSAQGLGAMYKGRPLGTIGRAGIYSFDIGKVITTGEGGSLVTNDEDIYLRAREYADHGHEQNPSFPRGKDTRTIWGFNYKMMELQGALGLAQIKKLNLILKCQRKNKSTIKNGIKDIPGLTFRRIPDPDGDAGDTLIFFMESEKRALSFVEGLSAFKIGTKNLPDAIDWHFAGRWSHIFGSFEDFKGKDLETVWGKSRDYLRRAVAIPIMVNMTEDDIAKLIEGISYAAKNS